jgi:dethiobiotin synthetase
MPIFITGIGTNVGKTLVAAIVAEALRADYWKPVQAGFADGTDAGWVKDALTNTVSVVHADTYRLHTPSSPHIAAAIDGITIDANTLIQTAQSLITRAAPRPLVIEGAGGLLVPLAHGLFVADIIKQLHAKVILVSRNYLGSINHSLLTAAYCRNEGLDVLGWIFNDEYLAYEEEIAGWSGYPSLGSIPKLALTDRAAVYEQAARLRPSLLQQLEMPND